MPWPRTPGQAALRSLGWASTGKEARTQGARRGPASCPSDRQWLLPWARRRWPGRDVSSPRTQKALPEPGRPRRGQGVSQCPAARQGPRVSRSRWNRTQAAAPACPARGEAAQTRPVRPRSGSLGLSDNHGSCVQSDRTRHTGTISRNGGCGWSAAVRQARTAPAPARGLGALFWAES